ncbi:hypothetical protein CCR98_11110 [Stenotrophomonas sp. WZN-1]|uniref:hypothetical protein n=1 Tax=Stenotrophomonas sp. WZN-1 TaxID=2005046 RepID=UPI000B43C400|nr:hypothetical protein [Stenotrophomonas sp. WZN-1]ARZ74702.1 hypothetical protein CCR98_11110 [Stenotrophomonas sp. WZN-1]
MRKLERPKVGQDFSAHVKAAKSAVETAVKAGKSPEFAAVWGNFKEDFAKAQLGKCGFCKGQVLGLQFGDVEHFRPKAEISELDDSGLESCGRELPWTYRIAGRVLKSGQRATGYWWLAYEWHNYLLSCEICNRQWKGNLFPIAGDRASGPDALEREQPLLLSPFDDFDPAEHFEFGRLGEVRGCTDRGRATVQTCGLDRTSLRVARYPTARAVHEHMDALATDISEPEVLWVLRGIQDAGIEQRPYCGMVRAIFCKRSGLEWEKLESLIAALSARVPARKMLSLPMGQ